MRIAVVGAGAVGCLFGARLAASGASVVMIGRAESVAALGRDGVTVEGRQPGRWSVEARTALDPRAPPDLVLLTVKTFDLPGAAAALGAALRSPVPVLLPQNGLHVERPVIQALAGAGWDRPATILVRAVNSIPATLVRPGVVRQPGDGELVVADPSGGGPSADAAQRLIEALRSAGLPVRTVADLGPELWRKALVNAAINPVTALNRIPNGRLGESPYREEARALLREAQRAAGLAGFPFSDDEADRSLDRVVRATADNRSSMLQDVERGRPTEIDAISGEILRTAEAHGVDLPATRAVLRRLSGRPGTAPSPAQPS